MTLITPAAAELDRFARLLDALSLDQHARIRLYNLVHGYDFENERLIAWATTWPLEVQPGMTLKTAVLRANPILSIRDIPTTAQITHALTALAQSKENA